MPALETAGKATLFGTAISIITAGTQLIANNFKAGLACLIAGIALIIIWAYLIDYQARKEATKAAEKAFEKFKLEIQQTKKRSKHE